MSAEMLRPLLIGWRFAPDANLGRLAVVPLTIEQQTTVDGALDAAILGGNISGEAIVAALKMRARAYARAFPGAVRLDYRAAWSAYRDVLAALSSQTISTQQTAQTNALSGVAGANSGHPDRQAATPHTKESLTGGPCRAGSAVPRIQHAPQ